MKKRILIIILVALLLLAILAPIVRASARTIIGRASAMDAHAYTDTSGHWAEAEIRFVTKAGLMQGLPDGSFAPDKPMTRAEFLPWCCIGSLCF